MINSKKLYEDHCLPLKGFSRNMVCKGHLKILRYYSSVFNDLTVISNSADKNLPP